MINIKSRVALTAVIAAVFVAILLVQFTPQGAAAAKKAVEVRFVTYNICGLPDLITRDRGLAAARKRFPLIGERLRNYDIISLQEVFIPQRTLVIKKLFNYYLARGTDSGMPTKPGSGIYVLSRWSIPRYTFEKWNDLEDYDSWSHKGFLGTTTVIPDGPAIDIYGLHAQAGHEKTRKKNYQQLIDALVRNSIGTGRPIILMGDFNCDMRDEDCHWLIENAGLTHVNPNLPNDQIDHIFYIQNNSEWKINVKSFGFVFDKPVNGHMLSDHNGYAATIEFTRK